MMHLTNEQHLALMTHQVEELLYPHKIRHWLRQQPHNRPVCHMDSQHNELFARYLWRSTGRRHIVYRSLIHGMNDDGMMIYTLHTPSWIPVVQLRLQFFLANHAEPRGHPLHNAALWRDNLHRELWPEQVLVVLREVPWYAPHFENIVLPSRLRFTNVGLNMS